MSDISKIKLTTGSVLAVKDAQARADLATLTGNLKAAAYRDVAAAISDVDGKIADAATVKAYVDAQIGSINKFDVVIAASLPDPTADTMYKLYLIPDITSTTGSYVEYITIRTEVVPETDPKTYTYSWERIGTTSADLTQYVKKTTTIAGIDLEDNISVVELQTALGLGAMAYAATGTGTGSVDTIDSIEMNATTVAGNATVTTTEATATISQKMAYTPAGTITVSLNDNSFNVIDSVGTQATFDTSKYTPGSLTKGTAVAAAIEGVTVAMGTDHTSEGGADESEILIFTAASTDNVMDFDATYTQGTMASDIFTANTLPTKKSQTVSINEHSFAGTEVANLIPTEVKYDKADATAAFSESVTPTVKTYTKTAKTVTSNVVPTV